jgi:hypothetical protein
VTHTKKQNEQHIIDTEGERLLRAQLPTHWILRPYRPDYELDFTLEIFARSPNGSDRAGTYETLGEHIFIQLKSSRSVDVRPLAIYGRGNVEKAPEQCDKDELIGTLDTARFSMESSELVTVERMGVGVPVLLILADLQRNKCYFVCLNDYSDKILVPRHRDYASSGHRTIHVPVGNDLENPDTGHDALRWYGKRAKLYSAFQRFVYQAAELAYVLDTEQFLSLAKYFAAKIVNYDFWNNTEMWPLLSKYGQAVRHFLVTGRPEATTEGENCKDSEECGSAGPPIDGLLQRDILGLWRRLSVLPRNYEEVQREWFLPTGFGYLTSFANAANSLGYPQ